MLCFELSRYASPPMNSATALKSCTGSAKYGKSSIIEGRHRELEFVVGSASVYVGINSPDSSPRTPLCELSW